MGLEDNEIYHGYVTDKDIYYIGIRDESSHEGMVVFFHRYAFLEFAIQILKTLDEWERKKDDK